MTSKFNNATSLFITRSLYNLLLWTCEMELKIHSKFSVVLSPFCGFSNKKKTSHNFKQESMVYEK